MIGISKLYCGTVQPSDALRYARDGVKTPAGMLQFNAAAKPVVVYNCTRRCNLSCRHCYSGSSGDGGGDELATDESKRLLNDLGEFGVPVVLFSGGEPTLRPDLLDLIAHARQVGLRAVVSTNGTRITPRMAADFADAGLGYVGVSLDGLAETNDAFRGSPGAFAAAMAGIRHCREVGVKVGLRLTLTRHTADEIGAVFDLIECERISRVCFYHLVYTGRGAHLADEDLPHDQTRAVLDTIMDRTRDLHDRGRAIEVLTVDNHADGPYVYLRLLREDPAQAAKTMQLMRMNRGNATGERIACVGWAGTVHPDQFWHRHVLGSVRRRPFSEIWTDPTIDLLAELRRRKDFLYGRCRRCRWLDVCNGNFRARAEAATGDRWGDDPACYLTDAEIAPDTCLPGMVAP